MSEPLVPEIVEGDPFRDYALTARQYWQRVYEDAKDDLPEMTLDEFLDLNWQNRPTEAAK